MIEKQADRCRTTYILECSGREVYANARIFGIAVTDEGGLEVSEGYDGTVDTSDWTAEEKRELATHMIALWQQFHDEAHTLDQAQRDALIREESERAAAEMKLIAEMLGTPTVKRWEDCVPRLSDAD